MSRQLIDINKTVELITMLLPVGGKNLLLPNVTVAEIIQLGDLVEPADMPNWFKGSCSWRGTRIPIIAFGAINQDELLDGDHGFHAAVINGSFDATNLPFYAIVTESTPRMMRISNKEIVENSDIAAGPAELMTVDACGEAATIPNLDYIEELLVGIVSQLDQKMSQAS